ncbi:MAG: hypothetical protein WDW38_005123 [Sanguina aurantia]
MSTCLNSGVLGMHVDKTSGALLLLRKSGVGPQHRAPPGTDGRGVFCVMFDVLVAMPCTALAPAVGDAVAVSHPRTTEEQSAAAAETPTLTGHAETKAPTNSAAAAAAAAETETETAREVRSMHDGSLLSEQRLQHSSRVICLQAAGDVLVTLSQTELKIWHWQQAPHPAIGIQDLWGNGSISGSEGSSGCQSGLAAHAGPSQFDWAYVCTGEVPATCLDSIRIRAPAGCHYARSMSWGRLALCHDSNLLAASTLQGMLSNDIAILSTHAETAGQRLRVLRSPYHSQLAFHNGNLLAFQCSRLHNMQSGGATSSVHVSTWDTDGWTKRDYHSER